MNIIKSNSREGWAADSARIAEMGDDELTWPEFANDEDTSLQTDVYCKFIGKIGT